MLDRDGRLLRAYTAAGGFWRLPVRLDEVDPDYINMLIAYEDRRFRSHHGVDPVALLRAALQFAGNGRIVSGGSTITMQLAPVDRAAHGALAHRQAATDGARAADRAAAEQGSDPFALSHARALWRQPRRRARRKPCLVRARTQETHALAIGPAGGAAAIAGITPSGPPPGPGAPGARPGAGADAGRGPDPGERDRPGFGRVRAQPASGHAGSRRPRG